MIAYRIIRKIANHIENSRIRQIVFGTKGEGVMISKGL